MVPQFGVVTQEGDKFELALSMLRINDRPVKYERVADFFSLSFGHLNQKGKSADFNGRQVPFADLGLENIIIEDHTGSTAYHIPQGCLFIYEAGGTPRPHPIEISTRDIFQAMTANFGFSASVIL